MHCTQRELGKRTVKFVCSETYQALFMLVGCSECVVFYFYYTRNMKLCRLPAESFFLASRVSYATRMELALTRFSIPIVAPFLTSQRFSKTSHEMEKMLCLSLYW